MCARVSVCGLVTFLWLSSVVFRFCFKIHSLSGPHPSDAYGASTPFGSSRNRSNCANTRATAESQRIDICRGKPKSRNSRMWWEVAGKCWIRTRALTIAAGSLAQSTTDSFDCHQLVSMNPLESNGNKLPSKKSRRKVAKRANATKNRQLNCLAGLSGARVRRDTGGQVGVFGNGFYFAPLFLARPKQWHRFNVWHSATTTNHRKTRRFPLSAVVQCNFAGTAYRIVNFRSRAKNAGAIHAPVYVCVAIKARNNWMTQFICDLIFFYFCVLVASFLFVCLAVATHTHTRTTHFITLNCRFQGENCRKHWKHMFLCVCLSHRISSSTEKQTRFVLVDKSNSLCVTWNTQYNS